jgi:hypothetical protein
LLLRQALVLRAAPRRGLKLFCRTMMTLAFHLWD